MSAGRKLASNSVYLLLDWVIATLAGFIYWIMIGKLMKPESLGIISTSFNIASIVTGISMLGLGTAVWKLLPEYIIKKRTVKVVSLIRFSFKTIIALNVVAVVFFLIFTRTISDVVNIPVQAVIIVGIMVLTLSISTHSGMITYGFQNMKNFLFSDIWGQVVRIAVSFILILLSFDYLGPMFGLVATFSITAIFRLAKIPIKGRTENIDKKNIMLQYALPALTAFIFSSLFSSGQYVLLTALQNARETGIYTVSMTILSTVNIIPSTLAGALFPIISGLSAGTDMKKQRPRLMGLVFRYSLFLTLPLALFLMVFTKPIILLLFRSDYLPTVSIFPILALSSLVYGIGALFLNNLYAIGKTKINRNITIISTVLFFLTAVPLIKWFSAMGLAISYGIIAVVLFSLSYLYFTRYVKLRLPIGDMLKIVASSFSAVSVVYFLAKLFDGIIADIILVGFGAVVYLSVLLSLKFYKEEDIRVLNIIREKIPRAKKYINLITRIISR